MSKASRGADHPARERRLERLSLLDVSNLRVEDHGLPMHVAALAILEGTPLLDDSGQVRLTRYASTSNGACTWPLVYARCFTGQGSVWDRRSGSTTRASTSVSTSKPAPFPRPATRKPCSRGARS